MIGAAIEPILPAWFAILGAVVGSFLNVVIYRWPRGYRLSMPKRSVCTACMKTIPWHENVPVLSWVFLRGKCSGCGARVSARYPLVEILAALLFFAVQKHFGFTFNTFFFCAFAAALLAVTFIDIDFRIIPDEISILGTVVLVAMSPFVDGLGFTQSLIGACSASFAFWVLGFAYEKITGREGLGFGDVKLLAFVGAALGWRGALATVVASSFIGSACGVILMVLRKKDLKMSVPFGPFIAIGALLSLFWGDSLLSAVYPF